MTCYVNIRELPMTLLLLSPFSKLPFIHTLPPRLKVSRNLKDLFDLATKKHRNVL